MFVSPDSIPLVGTATELDVRFFWPHLWGCLFLLTASRGDDLIPSPVSPDLRLCGEHEKNSSVWAFGWNDKALFLGRLVTDCFRSLSKEHVMLAVFKRIVEWHLLSAQKPSCLTYHTFYA